MKAYNKENIPLAKALRKNMTPWERKLWYDFFTKLSDSFSKAKSDWKLYRRLLLRQGKISH